MVANGRLQVVIDTPRLYGYVHDMERLGAFLQTMPVKLERLACLLRRVESDA